MSARSRPSSASRRSGSCGAPSSATTRPSRFPTGPTVRVAPRRPTRRPGDVRTGDRRDHDARRPRRRLRLLGRRSLRRHRPRHIRRGRRRHRHLARLVYRSLGERTRSARDRPRVAERPPRATGKGRSRCTTTAATSLSPATTCGGLRRRSRVGRSSSRTCSPASSPSPRLCRVSAPRLSRSTSTTRNCSTRRWPPRTARSSSSSGTATPPDTARAARPIWHSSRCSPSGGETTHPASTACSARAGCTGRSGRARITARRRSRKPWVATSTPRHRVRVPGGTRKGRELRPPRRRRGKPSSRPRVSGSWRTRDRGRVPGEAAPQVA